MKCYELKDDTLREGLLISDGSGPPRICVTGDEALSIPLNDSSVSIYKKVPPLAPVRMKYAAFTKDRQELLFSKKVDKTALVRLEIRGGAGGLVTCTSCAFGQAQKDDSIEVEKVYEVFPSVGIEVLGDHWEFPYPWTAGAERIELLLTMHPHSQFRVFRTGHLRGLRKNMFVSWDGFELMVTPPKKETLRLPVEGVELSL